MQYTKLLDNLFYLTVGHTHYECNINYQNTVTRIMKLLNVC